MPRVSDGQKIPRLTHPNPAVLLALYTTLLVMSALAIVMIGTSFAGHAARVTVRAATTVYLDVPHANCTCAAAEEAARQREVERLLLRLQNSSVAFVRTVYAEAAGVLTSVDCHEDHENETVSTWGSPRAMATLRCSISDNVEHNGTSIMEEIEIDTDVFRDLDVYVTQDGARHPSNKAPMYIRIAAAVCQFCVFVFAFGFGWAQRAHYYHLCRLRRPPSRGCRTVQRADAVQPVWRAGRRVFPEYEMQEAPYGRGYYVDPPVPAAAQTAGREQEPKRAAATEEPVRRNDDSEAPTRTVSQLTTTNEPTAPADTNNTNNTDSVKKHKRLGAVTAEEIATALEEEDSSWDDRKDQPPWQCRTVLPPVLSADFIDFDDFSDEMRNQPGITLERMEEDGTTQRMLTQEMRSLRASHRRRGKFLFAVAVVFAVASVILPIVSTVMVIATSVTGGSEDAALQTSNHLKTSHGALTVVGCLASGVTVAIILLILCKGLY